MAAKCPFVLAKLRSGIELSGAKAIPHSDLYYAFELGDFSLHRMAPASFYSGCADLFGVDAAALSRGGETWAEMLSAPLLLRGGC
jgi:hypothetical protein